jgi:hypothetical protein
MVALWGSPGSDTCKVRQTLKKTSRKISKTSESKLSCSEISAITRDHCGTRVFHWTSHATLPPMAVGIAPARNIQLKQIARGHSGVDCGGSE